MTAFHVTFDDIASDILCGWLTVFNDLESHTCDAEEIRRDSTPRNEKPSDSRKSTDTSHGNCEMGMLI
jgi:hypothetical protein